MFARVLTGRGGRLLAGLLLLALVSTLGCGDKYQQRGTVTGKVTLDGKPVTAGTVAFITADNRTGSAQLDAQGKYTMKDAPVGEVTATVTSSKLNIRTSAAPKGYVMKPPPGAAPVGVKSPEEVGGKPDTATYPKLYMPIPEKYAKPDTSGLKYTVNKGEQTIDIPLTK